jgi:hypothetical protein
MTTQAATASRAVRALEVPRGWLASSRRQALVALLLYGAITVGYFGLPVLPHFGSACVCVEGATDPSAYMWNQAWWPHAVLHGLNPFFTNALFAPDGLVLGGQAALSPGPGLAAAPITLLFGPVVSYNVWMLASPVLAAFFAFLLCRYVSGSFAAGLFGGYVFGFSAYMLAQMRGHPNLVFIFMIPASVHLTLRLIDGRIGERRFIVLMALSLAALGLTSTEPALTFVVLGCVTLAVAFILVPAARQRLIAAAGPLLASGALSALLASPAIYYALKGNGAVPSQGNGDLYGGDALGFLVPTNLIRFGRGYFAAVSATFTSGNIGEAGTYVGLPLALIVAVYTINRWRRASTRFLFAMLAVVVVLILGSRLHIAGYPTIPLPWKVLGVSLLGEAVPVRLGLYMFLIVAVVAAMWLGQPRTGRVAAAKWALAAVSIAFLVPNLGTDYWHGYVASPPFFSTHQYRSALRRDEIVLALPYGQFGFSMLWQAETGMWFRMTEGYLGRKFPADYVSDPLWAALFGQGKPNPEALRSFIVRRHVGAVIVAPGTPPQWATALAAIGLKPTSLGGILLYRA